MSNNTVQYVITLKDLFSDKIKAAVKNTEALNNATNQVNNSLSGLAKMAAGAFAVRQVFQFGKDLLETSMQVEGFKNQMGFASGSMRQGAEDFEYVRRLSNAMGLDMLTSADAFAKFQGAVRGTAIEGQGAKEVFEGISMASTVMHLSAEQSSGALYALQQMMSKGRVYSEELTRQLGERLPGTLDIAARSMDMTKASLLDMMKKGQLMSEDFLPKFASQLKKEFGGGVEKAAESGRANFNRMSNAILDMKLSLSNTLMPVLTGFVTLIKDASDSVQKWTQQNKGNLYNFMQLGSFLKDTFAPTLKLIGAGFQFIFDIASKVAWAFKSIGTFGKVIVSTLGTIILTTWGYVKVVKALKIAEAEYNVVKAIGAALSGNWAALAIAGAIAVAGVTWALVDAQKSYNKEKEKGAKTKGLSEFTKTKLGETTKGAKGSEILKGSKGTTSESSKVSQPKPTNVYINIGKLVETQNIKIENATKDFAQKLHTAVAEVLLNVVNDTNRIATQ
jgi:tape measure domain-containing protein